MLRASQLPLAAWELTSAGMLPWLAAILLPWLVHRFLQRPQRTSDWAAVDLLLAAVLRRSRQINFQQWLLLALRMAAVALITLAVAGPVYHRFAIGSQAASQQHIALVLDRSFSMMVEDAGRTRFQRAQDTTRELITSTGADNVYSLIAWDQEAEDLLGNPTFDTDLVLSAVEELEPSRRPAELSVAIDAVEQAVDRCTDLFPGIGQHLVVFCSDRTQVTWAAEPETRRRLESLSKRVRMSLVDVDDARRDNVAIVDLHVIPELVLRDQSIEIIARVRAYGEANHEDLPVDLLIDGRRVGRETIDLAAGQEVDVRFPHAFVEEGAHAVEVTFAAPDDALAVDNWRHLVVEVRPKLHLACVEGYPGAATEVAQALAPAADVQTASRIVPEVLPQSRLNDLPLKEYDAVVLCSVHQLSQRESRQLARYAKEGGSLAVLLGSSTVNFELASLLPVEIAPELAVGEYRFDPLDYRHSIVRPFEGSHSAGLLSTSIGQYVRLLPRAPDKSLEVVMAFDTGDPALVVQRMGEGRVAVCALPATLRFSDPTARPWSSFPVSPSFLPIVRELVGYLVGDNWLEQHNLLVGQPAVLPSNEFPPDSSPQVLSPTGRLIEISSTADQSVIADTNESGIYRQIAGAQSDTNQTPLLAVNVDPRESDLRFVDSALLPVGLTDVEQVDTEQSNMLWGAVPLAGSLLTLAIATLLLESTLAWWLGRSWG